MLWERCLIENNLGVLIVDTNDIDSFNEVLYNFYVEQNEITYTNLYKIIKNNFRPNADFPENNQKYINFLALELIKFNSQNKSDTIYDKYRNEV